MENAERYTSTIRVRLSASDAHYGGQLVNGAYMLSLFGEVTGRITKIGRTSRRMELEARKVICARHDISDSAADVLETPILVGRAIGTTVVKVEQQRRKQIHS